MGRGKCSHKLYIIDFGLAKKFLSKDGTHIPYRENKNLMNLKLDYLYLCNMLDISKIIMGREKES